MKLFNYIKLIRPYQWTKNLLIFAGLVFSLHLTDWSFARKSILAFFSFCLLAGSVYAFNDLIDLEKDLQHPEKKKRPLPSGNLSRTEALLVGLISGLIGFSLAWQVNFNFLLIAVFFWILIQSYTFYFKRVAIMDVMIIAAGFVLRTIAGAVAIEVEISSWLVLCAIFLALFLSLSKRRNEIITLGNDSAYHRSSLIDYNPALIDQMIAITTAATIICYALYTASPSTHEKFGNKSFEFTIPFVIYGIFRYLYLIYQKNLGGNPEMILLTDKPTILNIILWLGTIGYLIYL